MLAGIPVQDDLILKLARMVDDDQLADRLEHAHRAGVKILALELADRETTWPHSMTRHPAWRSFAAYFSAT